MVLLLNGAASRQSFLGFSLAPGNTNFTNKKPKVKRGDGGQGSAGSNDQHLSAFLVRITACLASPDRLGFCPSAAPS
jgi:hypothetical protein